LGGSATLPTRPASGHRPANESKRDADRSVKKSHPAEMMNLGLSPVQTKNLIEMFGVAARLVA
jgi:hypothetical protein